MRAQWLTTRPTLPCSRLKIFPIEVIGTLASFLLRGFRSNVCELTHVAQCAVTSPDLRGQSEHHHHPTRPTAMRPALTVDPGTRRPRRSTAFSSLRDYCAASASRSPSTPLPPRRSWERRTSTSPRTRPEPSLATSTPRASKSWHSRATKRELPTPKRAASLLYPTPWHFFDHMTVVRAAG